MFKKLLDAITGRSGRQALDQSQSADIWNLRREFAQHPARGLTPQKLNTILVDAEQGNLSAQADLFCDMEERDPHIYAEMSKRKRAILTLPWRIEPPRNASTAEKSLAAEVQEWMSDIPDFEDVMMDLLDGIGHGFSAIELEWELLGKLQYPCSFNHRPQRWFQTPHDNFDEIRLRDNSLDGAELWPLGWIVHKHKAKSGYITRAGLHRVLSWPYLFKNYSVRDLAEFLEVYGLPMRLGKYPTGATNDEKMTLLRAVTQIGHSAAGIIPQGMAIDFQEAAKGQHDPFVAMIDWCEKSQSKAILGGTLTSQADGKTSTNALGNVHNEVRHDLRDADARQLSSTLTRQLIVPWLMINKAGFDPRRAPSCVFDTQEPEDIVTYADALPKLVGIGMRIPEEWANKRLAIPLPESEDTPILKVATPEPSTRTTLATAISSQTTPPTPIKIDKAASLATLNANGLFKLLDDIPTETLQAVIEPFLLPVLNQLKAAKTDNEALSILANAYPTMDDSALQEQLTNLLFIADTWSRLSAQEELSQ